MHVHLKNIGTTLKTIREAKNMKQYMLQAALTSACNLSKIETNKSQVSLITFHEILNLLDISIDEFFMLHAAHDPNCRPSYETITDYLAHHASRVDKRYIHKALSGLSLYEHESLKNIKTIRLKLLYHQLSCFYYLNFEHDNQKAASHSAVLLDYYKNFINTPLSSDLNLLPMILPFVSIQEAQSLLADFDFIHELKQDKHYRIHRIYIHTQLTFAKKCIQERNKLLLQKTLSILDTFVLQSPTMDVYSELLIIKGIYVYAFEFDHTHGKALINQGLKLANDFQLFNLYRGWKQYTQNLYKTKDKKKRNA